MSMHIVAHQFHGEIITLEINIPVVLKTKNNLEKIIFNFKSK